LPGSDVYAPTPTRPHYTTTTTTAIHYYLHHYPPPLPSTTTITIIHRYHLSLSFITIIYHYHLSPSFITIIYHDHHYQRGPVRRHVKGEGETSRRSVGFVVQLCVCDFRIPLPSIRIPVCTTDCPGDFWCPRTHVTPMSDMALTYALTYISSTVCHRSLRFFLECFYSLSTY